MNKRSVATSFGVLTLSERQGAIVAVTWGQVDDQDGNSVLLMKAVAQVQAYARHELTAFDLPLQVEGSQVLRAVCAEIAAIPFGQTRTYGDIAKQLQVSAQVVGQACGQNPLPILVPCHRVMGANGLTGYSGAGGIETKVALLRHEGAAGLLI